MLSFFQSCNLFISFSCKDITQYVLGYTAADVLCLYLHTHVVSFQSIAILQLKNYKHKICMSKIWNTVDFYRGIFIRLITLAVFYTPIWSEIISAFIWIALLLSVVKIYSTIISNQLKKTIPSDNINPYLFFYRKTLNY